MNLRTRSLAVGLFTAAICAPSLTSAPKAAIILPNLPAGAIYQLVFVTMNGSEAYTNSTPSGGNNSVQIAANQNSDLPTTSWKAVASFGANASINAPVYDGVPVYNLAGQLVATGTDFYSSTHLAPICYDQFGNYAVRRPWTGMYPNGNPRDSINSWAATITCGYSLETSALWASESTSSNSMERRSWYGLSGQLVAVPEPTGCLAASLAIGFIIRLRHGRCRRDERTG